MRSIFAHLDLDYEAEELRSFLRRGAGVAFHADADGLCAGYLATLLRPGAAPPVMYQVFTEDLDLAGLTEWARSSRLKQLATFDINVLSADHALARLADSVAGELRVYDDHKGIAAGDRPNVRTVRLLPNVPDGLPEIRPASLFCTDLLRRSSLSARSRDFVDFVAMAAAYGEGVARQFKRFLPQLPANLDALARQVGRGINAFYTDLQLHSEDLSLCHQLHELHLSWEHAAQTGVDLATSVEDSSLYMTLMAAEAEVSDLVGSIVDSAARAPEWFVADGFPVFLVMVDAPRRIVHLAASATRTKLDRGVVVSRQETRAGIGLELRRARSLDTPDLAALLLDLDPEWFVSRGGHPMAAGATIKPGCDRAVFDAIRVRLEA